MMKARGKTFFQLSEQLLRRVLSLGYSSKRIDIIIDVYKDDSIKYAEQLRRGKETLLFRNIISDQQIKQWNNFLASSSSKNALIKFIVDDSVSNQKQKNLYVAFDGHKICVWKLKNSRAYRRKLISECYCTCCMEKTTPIKNS